MSFDSDYVSAIIFKIFYKKEQKRICRQWDQTFDMKSQKNFQNPVRHGRCSLSQLFLQISSTVAIVRRWNCLYSNLDFMSPRFYDTPLFRFLNICNPKPSDRTKSQTNFFR